MVTDTEIRLKGLIILAKYLGDVDAERFVALIQRKLFNYTKWRQGIGDDGQKNYGKNLYISFLCITRSRINVSFSNFNPTRYDPNRILK